MKVLILRDSKFGDTKKQASFIPASGPTYVITSRFKKPPMRGLKCS